MKNSTHSLCAHLVSGTHLFGACQKILDLSGRSVTSSVFASPEELLKVGLVWEMTS